MFPLYRLERQLPRVPLPSRNRCVVSPARVPAPHLVRRTFDTTVSLPSLHLTFSLQSQRVSAPHLSFSWTFSWYASTHSEVLASPLSNFTHDVPTIFHRIYYAKLAARHLEVFYYEQTYLSFPFSLSFFTYFFTRISVFVRASYVLLV